MAEESFDNVRQQLNVRYAQRAERLGRLKLRDLIRQNPYLHQLLGLTSTVEILRRLVEDDLVSAEAWWNELARDHTFCVAVSRELREYVPARGRYEVELANALNRLSLQLINEFCNVDYELDWEKLLLVNGAG